MSELIVSLPGDALLRALQPAPRGVRFVRWDLTGEPPLPHIDIVVPPYMGPTGQLSALSRVSTRLVQSQSIGFDGVAEVLPPGHRFANAATVHETSTAELAVTLILATFRGIPDLVRAQDAGRWAPKRLHSLADSRVLIVGFGGIGRALERRLGGFEVTIDRVAAHARVDATGPIHGVDALPALLPTADVVVLAVPLTPGTTGLVDAGFLAAMRDGATLVNVSRGPVVVTDALVRELSTGRLRAALDVTDPEPLPPGHPLWNCPGLLLSPHLGGATTAMLPRMAALIRRQIAHLLAGEPPECVVL